MNTWNFEKVFRRLSREFSSRFFVDRGDQDDAIFIAGSGRSGTTWIADSVAQAYNYRLVFEPFWHLHVDIEGEKDFFHHRYIRANDKSYDSVIRKILECRYRNYKTNISYSIGPYDGRVIKDICANLFLDRITALRPSMPVIFVVRSPYDVIESRLKKKDWGRPWGLHAEIFLSQKDLLAEVGILPALDDELLDHAVSYCMENIIPLRASLMGEAGFLLLKYEDFKADTVGVLKQIDSYVKSKRNIECGELNYSLNNKYLMTSAESKKKHVGVDGGKASNLSGADLARINNLLENFGVWDLFDNLGLGYERRS